MAVVAKAVLGFVALMVRAFGGFIEVLAKLLTGPMRTFLGVISKLPGVGGAAKAGLKLLNDGIASIGDFADKTAAKIEGLKGKVDSFTAAANKAAKAGQDAKSGSGKGGGGGNGGGGDGGLTDDQKKKLEGYKKDVASIYKDMNEVIADAQEKAQEALDTRNEKMFDAHKKYDERVAQLNKQFAEAMAEANKRYAEASAEAQKRRNKAETEAYKRHSEALDSINKDYNEKKIDLEKNLASKLDEIRKTAFEKTNDLTQAAAEKQANIIQQSMDRLRNAFASKTGFDLGDVFKGGADSADKLLADLKNKLKAAKELQANAAALAGAGYSQVFIEEVVKQGPEAGNKIAEALKAASPEATKELQALYGEVENVSAHGLDTLAQTVNAGGKLATEELMKSFTQVSTDLKQSLAEVNIQMNDALAEANKNYNEAMAEAEKARTEKIAEADKTLLEALA